MPVAAFPHQHCTLLVVLCRLQTRGLSLSLLACLGSSLRRPALCKACRIQLVFDVGCTLPRVEGCTEIGKGQKTNKANETMCFSVTRYSKQTAIFTHVRRCCKNTELSRESLELMLDPRKSKGSCDQNGSPMVKPLALCASIMISFSSPVKKPILWDWSINGVVTIRSCPQFANSHQQFEY